MKPKVVIEQQYVCKTNAHVKNKFFFPPHGMIGHLLNSRLGAKRKRNGNTFTIWHLLQ